MILLGAPRYIATHIYAFVCIILTIITRVVPVWLSKLWLRLTRTSPLAVLQDKLRRASSYEAWRTAALELDNHLGYTLWRRTPASKHYEVGLIDERLAAIVKAHEYGSIFDLVSNLRSGLVRNLGNITTPKLFNHAYAGTKLLIEHYITQVALAVDRVTAFATDSAVGGHGFTHQNKLDTLHDARQAFGRTALVLQGGSIFGLFHLGVVLALHKQGLLPRIILGTATGALIAALVCVHTEEELPSILTPEGIDLSAFARTSGESANSSEPRIDYENENWVFTSIRRLRRLWKHGHLLDSAVLQECVRANVKDLTFDEAYARTKRILNITVPRTDTGVPMLLNYLTAPSVLIWSAALASNASSPKSSPVQLMCKDWNNNVIPWVKTEDFCFFGTTTTTRSTKDRYAPSTRLGELFNVNHFIVSQARPYVAPFLKSEYHQADPRREHNWRIALPIIRFLMQEVQHRLSQFDDLGLMPAYIRRFLLDETIPPPSLVILPELHPTDFLRLLENPSKKSVDYWIRRGERSVWPLVIALKVRCAVEVQLERGYQFVRRKKPFDAMTPITRETPTNADSGIGFAANAFISLRDRNPSLPGLKKRRVSSLDGNHSPRDG